MAVKPTSLHSQLKLLKDRHLIIDKDEEYILKFLEQNNYYRIRGYFDHLYENEKQDSFINGSSFSYIQNIYEFDSTLRLIINHFIEDIEIFTRSIFAHYFSLSLNDAFFLYNDDIFHFNEYGSKVEKVRTNLNRYIHNHKKSKIVKHYTIDDKCLLPIWASIEFLSFGDISMLYQSVQRQYSKEFLSKYFKIDQRNVSLILNSWLFSLTKLRNISHHFERLFDIKLKESPPKLYSITNLNHLYSMTSDNQMSLFSHVFIASLINPKSESIDKFIEGIIKLQIEYPNVSLENYGFPCNWENILRYSISYLVHEDKRQ